MKNRTDYYDMIECNMKERIRTYQKNARDKNGKRIRDQDVVVKLGELIDGRSTNISLKARINRYKNYKNDSGNQRYISMAMLDRLAETFGCSTAALLGTEQPIHGSPPPHKPIHDELSTKLSELVRILEKDIDSIRELYFLYCELPPDESKQMVKALFTFMDQIYNNSIYSSSVQSLKRRSILMRKIINSDPFYDKRELILMEAADFIHEKNRAKALASYLKVITDSEDDTDGVFKKAAGCILSMHKHWKGFPEEVYTALGKPTDDKFNPVKDINNKEILKKFISDNL